MKERTRDEKGRYVQESPGLPRKKQALYGVWCGMNSRCYCKTNHYYGVYGGKGIKVCHEWRSDYEAFKRWAEDNGYEHGLTIDRIDNRKGYSPENCRWVTTAQQNRNYSRNHNITYNGKTLCVTDWAKETGINKATILFRIKQGKPLEEVFINKDGRATRWKKEQMYSTC